MKHITVVADPTNYPDRLASIDEFSPYVERNVVICKRHPSLDKRLYPHIEFVEDPEGRSSLSFFFWAARTAKKLTSGEDRDWCVVEVATAFTLIFLRVGLRSKARLVQHVVTPSRTVFKERGWSRDRFAPRLHIRQALSWYYRIGQQILVLRAATWVCDGFLCNSSQCEEDVHALRPTARTACVPNAVSIPMRPAAASRDLQHFLAVSGVQPYKGFGVLLTAFEFYLREVGEARLSIAGRIPVQERRWFDQLQDRFRAVLPMVTFLGPIDRDGLNGLYQNASALVHTSYYEGSPRVIYEALSNGCPVLASDIPGIRDICVNSDWLRLFPRGDVQACYQALRESLSLRRDDPEMIEFMQMEYSPERRARKYMTFVKGLLDEPINEPSSQPIEVSP